MNIELDEVFTIKETGNRDTMVLEIETVENSPYVPTVEITETGELDMDSEAWTIVSGFSQQHGKTRGIMHPSEPASACMVNTVHSELGTDRDYVMTEVINPDDMDELIGWVMLSKAQ